MVFNISHETWRDSLKKRDTRQTDSDKYPYSGPSALMGKIKRDFQDTDYVLRLFGKKVSAARKAYRAYVEKGIAQGRRPVLVGGGLMFGN